ncbi:YfhO family protein [Flavobacteriaceae bacterium]|nr:YfhO family protein [Flavobacteriaceae bacterium]MDB9712538.1 YfhO family protein [Flavobacteriaceae bacterium]MDC1491921.1 YfhO family protein [Flavobacteriaceae bacterium]
MKKLNNLPAFLKNNLHHLIVFVLFIIISVSYFYPVLNGEKIYQSDIVQYSGMAKQQNDFRAVNDSETYWTDSAFSGMPTYLLGAKYPHNYIKKIDLFLRFLPRPADYLFLYLIGFYVFLLVLKIDYKLAFLGSVFFAFSTYLIIIIGAGHNSKAHAIAYMPLVLSGIILVFNKNYYKGFFLTTLALGLEICANHFQMTYYLMFIILLIGLYFFIDFYKRKSLRDYFKSLTILFSALFISIALNASTIMSTYEYSKESTRGSSEITINPDGSQRDSSGLDYNYITEYSYGIFESLNLFIPRIVGGGSVERLNISSETYKYFRSKGADPFQSRDLIENTPTYWGNQPIVEAPAYTGVVVFFLFILSLFLVSNKNKYWLLGSILIALLLSYGKNFPFLTNFFIDYFPLYDKFRAVSSIQVILELCIPVLAILSLSTVISKNKAVKDVKSALNKTLIIFIVLLIGLYLSTYLIGFNGVNDSLYADAYGPGYLESLKLDRINMFKSDLFRTFIYVILSFSILSLYRRTIISTNLLIISFLILGSIDLISFNKNYVNSDNFVTASKVIEPYLPNDFDLAVLNDKSKFRVLDESTNSTKASYFHNSVLGYHAAKLSNYDALLKFYILKTPKKKSDVEIFLKEKKAVLNMLNVKYFISKNDNNEFEASINEDANGNAWFVKKIYNVESENKTILSMGSMDLKNSAVSTKLKSQDFNVPANASIELVDFKSNYLKYSSSSNDNGYVVFSEIYYSKGWKVYVNGKETNFDNVNVALRGLYLNKGENTIECFFKPDVVRKSSYISLGSSILILLLFGTYIFYYNKKSIKLN